MSKLKILNKNMAVLLKHCFKLPNTSFFSFSRDKAGYKGSANAHVRHKSLNNAVYREALLEYHLVPLKQL